VNAPNLKLALAEIPGDATLATHALGLLEHAALLVTDAVEDLINPDMEM